VHVSGDQRFVLHVNGRRVGIGPSRGDILFWRFETFDLAPFLKPGANLLTALVWNFGTQAPAAQISDRTGFVVQGDGDAEQRGEHRRVVAVRAGARSPAVAEGMNPLRKDEPHYIVVGPGERLGRRALRLELGERLAAGRVGRTLQARVVSAGAFPRSISEGPGYSLTPDGRQLVPDELPPMEYRDDSAARS
jgi:hypothetical protein